MNVICPLCAVPMTQRNRLVEYVDNIFWVTEKYEPDFTCTNPKCPRIAILEKKQE